MTQLATIPRAVHAQIAKAYRTMANEARYRPAAPSDGFGHITVPEAKLNLDAEADAYAHRWCVEEDELEFWTGCPDFRARPAMVYAIEVARLCCGGADAIPAALRVARLAVEELERGVGQGVEKSTPFIGATDAGFADRKDAQI